jgi:iron(II)-dependent oxidoreductase
MICMNGSEIAELLIEARARTLDLVADLSDEQMIGPRLDIVNPPLWEIGHVAWFLENWALRHLRKQAPLREGVDLLYDSAAVAHETRWDLPLPSRRETLAYMQDVLDCVIQQTGVKPLTEQETYFHLLALYHEYMHSEAIAYTRQTLSYPAPRFSRASDPDPKPQPENCGESAVTQAAGRRDAVTGGGPLPGDVWIAGGAFMLGAAPGTGFVFDNEKWAHAVEVRPFRIARAPVTNVEFAAFVNEGGYAREALWSAAGREWLQKTGAEHPVYWQPQEGGNWLVRRFDRFVPLENHLPVLHVSWYEAEAYCKWAARRLPSEAEWEMAASVTNDGGKRKYPWGNESPTAERANLDWRAMECLEVGALPDGDSVHGCRQMIGNVWEWVADDFSPYPGFVIDPYKEYSAPWFGNHKVLRGGCWTTRSRLIRSTWRNFYTPDRRDVWAGFRTCAVEP